MSEYDFTGGIGEAELQELQALRIEKWRDEAIKANPAAAPFRDLLVASSPQAMNELAEDLASRVQGSGGVAGVNAAGLPVPVLGGSPPLPPQPNDEEELAGLKEEARRTGDWTNILRHMRHRAVEGR